MTGSLDPWRTLGLTPGASIDEIRRAYRRLAKVNHPDAAGEAALPRFLAIQSAYEALAGPRRGRRPGTRPDGSTGAGSTSRRGAATKGKPTADGGPAAGRTKAGRADEGGPGGAAGSSRRTGGRRRQPNRATPGSTSYDAADEEPFEPGWTGATWYGASSGTYWTINPKEYADPRKHGPEYQRRARRSASGRWIIDDEPGEAPDAEESSPGSTADEPDPGAARRGRRRAAAAAASPDATAADESPPPAAAHRPSWTSAGREPGERAPGGGRPPFPPPGGLGPARGLPLDGFAAPLLRLPTTPAGRLGLALLGWPPLGVAAATAVGESTGCGRFAASCAEVFSPGTWILQIAIVLLLLALPRLAGWSAVGTLAALAAAIPTAIALSAGGGSRQPEASAGVLLAVLGLAYVVGVAWAIARRWWPPGGTGRVP